MYCLPLSTALHEMQTRSSDENSVWPSVYQTRELWQNRSFLGKRMVGKMRPLLPEILGQSAPVGAKLPIFKRYSLVAPQP